MDLVMISGLSEHTSKTDNKTASNQCYFTAAFKQRGKTGMHT